MPKADAGGLKAFCNRIKSKGLQKLRWYCQMCQKQCRDENGMKCHMRSEGHIRQMRVFAENPDHILSDFSKDFEKTFLDVLSHRHGTKRIQANQVYKEYIADKHHVHMNSTQWTSLTGFIKYLGKEGRVICDETEKGWFITYIGALTHMYLLSTACNFMSFSNFLFRPRPACDCQASYGRAASACRPGR